MKYILCRYSEIGLKKGNRSFFENCLIENIKKSIKPELFSFVKRISGRILIELTREGEEKKEEIKEKLMFVFGISSFSFCNNTDQCLESMKKMSLEVLKKEKFEKFKVSTTRSKKEFPLFSREINEKIGEHILNNFKKIKVDLEKPDVTCFIEIIEKYSFVFTGKEKGLNGLPVGSSGKAVSLLSGGIDSPVASFQAMRRGIKLIFVHFHSYPQTSQASINKVKELAGILSRYQGTASLYLVPISGIQKEIVLGVSEKMRVIFYRRIMYKIAREIAIKEKAQAFVTGDSIGQVASQTLENMKAAEQGIEMLIIRPLACQDKESIVRKAKEIGTYEISILPHDDCCSRFIPAHPETKADIKDVLKEERKINIQKMVEKAIKEMKIITINEQ